MIEYGRGNGQIRQGKSNTTGILQYLRMKPIVNVYYEHISSIVICLSVY